jgi:hypothetical protein
MPMFRYALLPCICLSCRRPQFVELEESLGGERGEHRPSSSSLDTVLQREISEFMRRSRQIEWWIMESLGPRNWLEGRFGGSERGPLRREGVGED